MRGLSWQVWIRQRLGYAARRRTIIGRVRGVAAELLEARRLPAAALPANHAPTDLVLANGYVIENSPAGTHIGSFGTADPDPGERFTYFVGGRFAGMFRVEGDRLLTNGEFDFETRDTYAIPVLAVDSRGASISRTVTIRVMDQPEEPSNPSDPQLVSRPHRDLPPSDSVANGYFGAAPTGIAGSEVVFHSPAPNLVIGDTNGRADVFVTSKDGKNVRISMAQDGQEANSDSYGGKISRNGRFVAFVSSATNLVAGDSNERNDGFVRDRVLKTTKRISLRSDGTPFSEGSVTEVAISANGRFVAFVVETYDGFHNNEGGLYVRDLLQGTTKRVVATPDAEPFPNTISISGDGRRIAYALYDDEQATYQVYVVERLTGAIQLVSVAKDGTVPQAYSSSPMISENGRCVVFESNAAGLVDGDENSQGGVFIRDLLTKTTRRVDLAFDGSAPYSPADSPSISADGRFVAFRSYAGDLLPPESSISGEGYFLRDLRTGLTQAVVVTLDGASHPGTDRVTPLVSGDGRYVAFIHVSSNLVPRDLNDGHDVFLRDTRTNTTELITRRDPTLPSATSIATYGNAFGNPSLTTDGTQAFFTSSTSTLAPELIRDVGPQFAPKLFFRNLTPPGDIAPFSFTTYAANVSQNGRFLLFETYWSLVPEDTQYDFDWYVLDRETGHYTRANLGSDGSRVPRDLAVGLQNALSNDGRFVVFSSDSPNVVAGDTNRRSDIFVRDLLLGTTTRVSIAPDGSEANGGSGSASISLDGRFVVFSSDADNLVPDDHNRTTDIFVRDLLLETTERVSVNSEGEEGNGISYSPLISGDGRCVAFVSAARNFVDAMMASTAIFWHDRLTGVTKPVSLAQGSLSYAQPTSISNDGRFVVFESGDPIFVPGDTNQTSDVFVRDLLRDKTVRASVGPNGREANGASHLGIISGDGTKLAFITDATNLVPNDFNASNDVVLVDLATISEVAGYSVRVDQNQVSEDTGSPLIVVFERDDQFDRSTTISFRVSGTAMAFRDYQISGADHFDGTTGTITFGIGQSQVVVRVTPVTDKLVENTEAILVTLSDGVLTFPSGNQTTVSILDDERASFTVTPSVYAGTVTETGSSLRVFVVLDSQPNANVVLDVINGDKTEIKLSAKKLTFTPQNWNAPQPVTIRGIDDGQADGDQPTLVSFQINPLTADEFFKRANWLAFTSVETLDDGIGHRR